MKLLKIIFFLQITSIQSDLHIKEATEALKFVLNKYKNNYRHRRQSNVTSINNVASTALNFFQETERYEEFLKYLNVSVCGHGNETKSYVKRHIFHGLLIDPDVPESHWLEFKSVFNKQYPTSKQERAALSTWRRNLKHVAKHNRLYLAGQQSFALHLNQFGDFGTEDYISQVLKLIDSPPLPDPHEDRYRTAVLRSHRLHRRIPRRVDWRAKGFRPRRERQWRCGACYAFAVAHAMQAQLYRKHGDWTELRLVEATILNIVHSAQQLVDCSLPDGNYGCDGGSLRAAFRYAARVGLHAERDYPYRGRKGICLSSPLLRRVRARRWALLGPGDEAGMERALATIGPLAVAVNASPRSFQLYRSGIYDDPFCSPWQLNHAMLLVGYTPHYWILLNWWGRHWGEDGYIRIRRGFNRCGVANMAAYVEL